MHTDHQVCRGQRAGVLRGLREVRGRVPAHTRIVEKDRAASKSPHLKFGYLFSMSQQAVSADIIQNSARVPINWLLHTNLKAQKL